MFACRLHAESFRFETIGEDEVDPPFDTIVHWLIAFHLSHILYHLAFIDLTQTIQNAFDAFHSQIVSINLNLRRELSQVILATVKTPRNDEQAAADVYSFAYLN